MILFIISSLYTVPIFNYGRFLNYDPYALVIWISQKNKNELHRTSQIHNQCLRVIETIFIPQSPVNDKKQNITKKKRNTFFKRERWLRLCSVVFDLFCI